MNLVKYAIHIYTKKINKKVDIFLSTFFYIFLFFFLKLDIFNHIIIYKKFVLGGIKMKQTINETIMSIMGKPYILNKVFVKGILEHRKNTIRTIYNPGEFQIGDILCIKENWCCTAIRDGNGKIILGTEEFHYEADGYSLQLRHNYNQKLNKKSRFVVNWKPAETMPLQATRLFLKVTDIEVQNIQEMKHSDYFFEGISIIGQNKSLEEVYRKLWNGEKQREKDRLYWEYNPVVYVLHFDVSHNNPF